MQVLLNSLEAEGATLGCESITMMEGNLKTKSEKNL